MTAFHGIRIISSNKVSRMKVGHWERAFSHSHREDSSISKSLAFFFYNMPVSASPCTMANKVTPQQNCEIRSYNRLITHGGLATASTSASSTFASFLIPFGIEHRMSSL
jgi:hypothetical protein